MKFNAHPYQRRGVEWILTHPRCALFWQMGLGKSATTLTAIHQLMDTLEVSRTLIVAPKKVAEATWAAEAAKWDHLADLRVSRVLGTEKQRKLALATASDIYVTSRDNFVWLCGQYGGYLPFDMVVIDELTSFKSPKSQRFKAARIALGTVPRIVGLTGTPAPNGLVDLWAQMYCIDQGERLGKSVTRYRETYFIEHKWNNIVVKSTLRAGAETTIRLKIADICQTMQAADYLTLPSLIVCDEMVELPKKLADGYRQFERDMVLNFADQTRDATPAIYASSAAALMTKLSQYANGAIYDEERQVHALHDEKLQRLAELVESATAEGDGVLVFYQYQHDVPRLADTLKKYRVRKYTTEDDLKAWNAKEADVMLAHPASTAYGLNMQQGGHHIIWFGTGWNLELYQQANARLHRQGQQHPVTVTRLLCKGTVDERAARALEGKSSVQQALMDAMSEMIKQYKST